MGRLGGTGAENTAGNEMYELFVSLLDETASTSGSPHLAWMRWLPWRWYHLSKTQARFDSLLLAIIHKRYVVPPSRPGS